METTSSMETREERAVKAGRAETGASGCLKGLAEGGQPPAVDTEVGVTDA